MGTATNPLAFGADDAAMRRIMSGTSTRGASPDTRLTLDAFEGFLNRPEGTEMGERETDTCRALPVITLHHRVGTVDEATRLQLSYHTVYGRFARITKPSRRLALIDTYAHKDASGALCAYITGIVADTQPNMDRNMGRICLMSPCVSPTPRIDDRLSDPIDSHLWLMSGRLRPYGDYADADDPSELLHTDKPRTGRLHIGDMVTIATRLRMYRDANGLRRVGAGEWTPLARGAMYLYMSRTRTVKAKAVPRHLVRNLKVLDVHDDGTVEWADPVMLDEELDSCAERWPDRADAMRLTVNSF